MTINFGRTSDEIPDDVKSLDAELRSIQYEERPSFGPELEAELEREWARMLVQPRRSFRLRHAAAAAAVVLLLAGAGVPQARASLVRIIGSLQEPATEEVTPTPAFTTPLLLEPTPVEATGSPLGSMEEAPTRSVIPAEPPDEPGATDPATWPESTHPEIADRERSQALIRRHYPEALQRLGVTGAVGLRLWVKEDGSVDNVQMARGTGIPGLDRAALVDIAPSLRFRPATRRGLPVGTWVEFDVVFALDPNEELVAPPGPVDAPEVEPLDLAVIPEWQGEVSFVSPTQTEAEELLANAVGSDPLLRSLGPVESILVGDPPAGVAPTQWRSNAAALLEAAMVRAPDNPAPLLALARIRSKQGLRTEARVLLERGLLRAQRAGASIKPSLVAELHYERALLLQDAWRAGWNLGSVAASALADVPCTHGRAYEAEAGGPARVERLIAWNYLCPAELGQVIEAHFVVNDAGAPNRAQMVASFRSAAELNPAHVGANVAVLLALAEEGRWNEVLDQANDFVRASGGHPYGLLLGGVALQRLARSDEAMEQFDLALRGLPEAEAEALQDLAVLLDGELLEEYAAITAEDRVDWQRRFWVPLDPVLTTDVNEREVEHLARAAFARLRFGDAAGDPAEVLIRYGAPADVRVFGESAGMRTEFWDYGIGPDVTFTRAGSSAAMQLTPEGRAYVDDLMDVLPHRYGVASRRVFTLPGQVSRFLGIEPETMDFEIHTRVPRVLATGPGDTLDLGVFFVSPEGERAEITSRRVRAEEIPISLRIPMASQTGAVVVELFNARTGQAAALRQPVEPMQAFHGARISDLMVVAATSAPRQDEIRRGAGWIEPLVLAQPLDVDAVGTYFELYLELADVPRYYLRAEVVDQLTGESRSVPIRPAGESGFRDVWDRRPSRDGATREYLTVALTDVPRGQHTLRVVVDVPEVGSRLVATQAIDRREE